MQNTTESTHKLHWIIFCWPLFIFMLGVILLFSFPILLIVGLLFSCFGLIWLLMATVTYHFSSLTINEKKLTLTTGFLIREATDIPITKIESIDMKLPIVGSLLNYGSIIITGTGGTKYSIHYLHRPLTCRRKIEQLLGS